MTDSMQKIDLELKTEAKPPQKPPAPQINEEPKGRNRLHTALLFGLAAVVAGSLLVRFLPQVLHKQPQNVIVASGRIEGREVTLAAKEIQGRVRKLLVDEGDTVKKGQLLAQLESSQLDAQLANAQANVSNLDAQIKQASIDLAYTTKSTKASIAAAEAALSSAKAHLAHSKAVLSNTSVEYQRTLSLYNSGVVSKSNLDSATMNYQTSQADVDAAEKDLAQAQANLEMSLASKDTVDLKAQQLRVLEQSRRSAVAQLNVAEANVAEREIFAPTDGTILSRPVEVGDVVSPGSPIFVMVDMNRLYVKVYIPEPDIPKIKLGDDAEITVDAFRGRTFPARVTKIYEQAEFTPKNVETKEERVKLVFGVELTFVNPQGILKPGMPADGVIRWGTAASQPSSK